MPLPQLYTIGCIIHDARARARCHTAIQREGLKAVRDGPEALEQPRLHAQFAGIVYDLSPWDDTCRARLCQLRQVRPDIPVLLYFPPKPAAFEVLSDCAQLTQLRFRVQLFGEHSEGFHRDVRWLVRSVPQERIAAVLHQLLCKLGPTPSLMGRITLRYLASGRRPRVADVGRELRVSSRTLQRLFSKDLDVSPKQIIDLVTVWYVQYGARMTGMSLAHFAQRIAMHAEDYYRLARRVRSGTHIRLKLVEDYLD